MVDLLEILSDHFADDPMVYVSADLLIYYEEGDPEQTRSRRTFSSCEVSRSDHRDNYLIWEEGKGPDLVIELTSKHRRHEDQKKFELYRDVLKVPELFPIDPSGGYFDSPLRGFRWSESGYVPIEPGRGPGLHSEVLGLNLAREGYALRLFDPTTGRKLPTVAEELVGAETMRVQIEKARRLVAMETRPRGDATSGRREQRRTHRSPARARRDPDRTAQGRERTASPRNRVPRPSVVGPIMAGRTVPDRRDVSCSSHILGRIVALQR